MREAFSLFDTVAVSFSGGKDSTAVLHVTLDAAEAIGWKKKIPVFFFDEETIKAWKKYHEEQAAWTKGDE